MKDTNTLLHFYINQVDITQKFCVNKDYPALKCNGKCHFKKILRNEKQEEKKQIPVKKDSNPTQLFCVSIPMFLDINAPIDVSKKSLAYISVLRVVDYAYDLLKPPIKY